MESFQRILIWSTVWRIKLILMQVLYQVLTDKKWPNLHNNGCYSVQGSNWASRRVLSSIKSKGEGGLTKEYMNKLCKFTKCNEYSNFTLLHPWINAYILEEKFKSQTDSLCLRSTQVKSFFLRGWYSIGFRNQFQVNSKGSLNATTNKDSTKGE